MSIILTSLSLLLLISALLPLIRHDNWIFRIFEYPRVQKLILVIFFLILWVVKANGSFDFNSSFFILTLLCLTIYLMICIFPFTKFSPKMIVDCKNKSAKSIHLFVLNVYQYNSAYQKTIDLIQKEDPDVFFLVETDAAWAQAISVFKSEYPYQIEVPKDNTYGLLFYSKYEILGESVHYLIDEEVPSIELDLKIDETSMIQIFGIHPTPPVPSENPKSTDRDAEILLVGKQAKKHHGPCIVIGDLNDVGWSYTSELFLKTSGLLDLRRGRGMFNTFHAKHFFMRWPLDHIFVSKHFTLKSIDRLPTVGSDHFPISTKLCIQPINGNESKENSTAAQQE
ncbi:hypothetical protein Belba_2356 [Belliella baltica DSM 15883]|uniref:Endonuclease/exonuclease/phosphatase domain-containing protein n=1 Tax=Belliella baltica (strain DSM 15883 / CIP 108006 / LMG 21964 / BA134) TaxID=866536 RepID=I3Z6P8_BELBD|nr:endonuclease/exonuclease/phosphatase family protein [Belliella baltica]AFL84916.1 hypothetical protein Belba_2356 [Belliella baltica DSM 15883]